ncbi:DUF3048 domain-containing protein [Natronospora cellulosivora (SeqCode)]
MKKLICMVIFLLTVTLLFSSCDFSQDDTGDTDVISREAEEEINEEVFYEDIEDQDQLLLDELENMVDKHEEKGFYSPFTGLPANELSMQRATMVIIENAPRARPQSGLHEAAIIYELLAEGGITRFLALYWDEIPDEIGPVRSARPYKVDIANDYNALLLHAGGSPQALEMLASGEVDNIDQIHNGGRYFWRSSHRRAPHNLYTGRVRINDYLDKLLGQKYQDRFDFQRVSFITKEDEYADYIKINYWGGTTVVFKYDDVNNNYLRYYGPLEIPHKSDNIQLQANNIIIQYVRTRQIDDIGRLEMDLNDRGKALFFRDGIVVEGFWEKTEYTWTSFYDNTGQELSLNPGQTWIIVVPTVTQVDYSYTRKQELEETVDEEESEELDNDLEDSIDEEESEEFDNDLEGSIDEEVNEELDNVLEDSINEEESEELDNDLEGSIDEEESEEFDNDLEDSIDEEESEELDNTLED